METLNDWLKPELIWFLIGLVMMISEFVIPGFIVFFFGTGAWIVALICLFLNISINAQLMIFLVTSVVLLLSMRKWMQPIFVGYIRPGQKSDDNLTDFIGKKATVTRQIDPVAGGKVEFNGTSWSAEAEKVIPEGTVVEITGKSNLTLKVQEYST